MIYFLIGKKNEINKMQIKLISKNNLQKLIQADPNQRDFTTEKYYKFPLKYLYLKKIKLAIKLLNNKKYNKLLDIGFGGGVITPELASRCEQYFGIDVHEHIDLIKNILKNQNINNINLKKSSATTLPFENNYFDCIWCMSTLEFIKDSEKAIAEINRVAKNNAKIIIGFPITNKLTDILYKLIGFKSNEAHYNNHKTLLQQIKKYFKVKEIKIIPGMFLVCRVGK